MAREAFPLVDATSGHGSQLELTWLLCAVAFSMAFISVITFACGKSEKKPREKKGRSGGVGGGRNLAGAGGFYLGVGGFSGAGCGSGGGSDSSVGCDCGGSGGSGGGCGGGGGGRGC